MDLNKSENPNGTDKKDENPMEKLEEALLICKFGKFNWLLMIATISATFSAMVMILTASFILPSAECDLSMNMSEKGLLIAMPFIGQTVSAFFIGFVADALGRRKILISGNIGVFISYIIQGSAQAYWVLALGKFFDGIFLNVCYNITNVMLSECTNKKLREGAILIWSLCCFVHAIVVSIISWAILPNQWHFVIFKGYFELHSWNIYLYICSLSSILAATLYYCLPESPKYLLCSGRPDEALDVIKKIYSINTGKEKHTFPMTSLTTERNNISENKIALKQLVAVLMDAKSLFRQPLLSRLSLITIIHFSILFALGCLRFWYPQISTIIQTYIEKNDESGPFCEMIDDYMYNLKMNPSINNDSVICTPGTIGFDTYSNGIFTGVISIVLTGITYYLVKVLGPKPLLVAFFFICAFSFVTIYWINSLISISILFSAMVAYQLLNQALIYSILVPVFPTSVRALAFAFVMMTGRIGSFMGNILFPMMLSVSCGSPFIYLFASNIVMGALSLFLPNPVKEKNQGDNLTATSK